MLLLAANAINKHGLILSYWHSPASVCTPQFSRTQKQKISARVPITFSHGLARYSRFQNCREFAGNILISGSRGHYQLCASPSHCPAPPFNRSRQPHPFYIPIPFTFTQHVSINFAATSAEKGYSVLASRISFRANKKPGPCLKPSLSCVWAGPDVTTHQHH